MAVSATRGGLSDSFYRRDSSFVTRQRNCEKSSAHKVRNTLKYVTSKDRKEFDTNLKKTYTASDELTAAKIRDQFAEKWAKKYPHAMKSWIANWDAILPIFKFSLILRTIIYTTDAIEV